MNNWILYVPFNEINDLNYWKYEHRLLQNETKTCFLMCSQTGRYVLQLYHDDGCLFCGANSRCAQLSPSNCGNTWHANMGKFFQNICAIYLKYVILSLIAVVDLCHSFLNSTFNIHPNVQMKFKNCVSRNSLMG